jgi:threonine dehydrogenase-like Zn-dependent dehydrogenase
MRAAFLAEVGEIRVIDHPRPSAGPGEVVLRVGANSICGSDLSAYRGVHSRIKPPTILGHEFAGTVFEVGPGVEGVVPGTRVAVEPNIACGECRYCRAGFPNVCVAYSVIGEETSRAGACAEYVKVPAGQLYPLPEHVTAAEGALVQPLAISYNAVVNKAGVRPGQVVVIFGGGPIGLGSMLMSRYRGARTIVVDLLDYRLDMARDLGADLVVNPERDDLVALIRGETDGYGADISIEAVGGAQTGTFVQACRLTASQGKVIVLGSFKTDEAPIPIVDMKFREIEVIGSQGHPRTFAPTLELIASGELPAARMITHRFPLDGAAEAFRLLSDRGDGVMKVVIEP